MMTSLKIENRKKESKKIKKKMSIHQTGKMNQVTTSSKINTKLTNKTPP